MKRKNPCRTANVALCAVLAQLSVAVAEEAPLNSDEAALLQLYGEQDLISIATGYKQPVARAPAVASVITAEDIKAMGATDLDEVLETVPGLHVARSFVGYNPIYSFRGISSEFNPQVLVLVNGIPLTNSFHGDRGSIWGGMPVQAISRIEVIRGPGSAVYGADAFAGVINIITKTKDDIAGTEIGGRVGSYDTYDAWGLHGGEWAGFDVAAIVEFHDTNGQERIVDIDQQTAFDQLFGTDASLAPGPVNLQRQNFDARVDLSREHWRLRAGVQRRDNWGNAVGVAQALDPYNRYSSDRWNADLTYHNADFAKDWDVTAQISYLDSANEDLRNNLVLFPPGTVLPIGPSGGIDFSNGTLVEFPNGFIGNPEVFERHGRANLAAIYSGFADHTLRGGIGFNYDDMYDTRASQNFGLDPVTGQAIPFMAGQPVVDVTGTAYIFLPAADRQDYFFFAQDEWRFARDWQLTAGVRYDYYSDFGETVNPRVALVWEPRYDLTGKLLYGSAFRAPAFAEMYLVNNPVALGNPQLDPETMDTLELAVEYRPLESLNIGANAFYYWWRDIIRYVPDASGLSITAQNAGQQQGYGLELQADWRAAEGLRLLGNYAFQHSRDMNMNHEAGNAPQHQLYARADWEFMPDWHVTPQVKWVVGRQRVAGDGRPPVDDYSQVDLTLRRSKLAKHFEVAFSVRNLFDNDIREPSPFSYPAAPIPNDFPQAGRNFYGEIRFNF